MQKNGELYNIRLQTSACIRPSMSVFCQMSLKSVGIIGTPQDRLEYHLLKLVFILFEKVLL